MKPVMKHLIQLVVTFLVGQAVLLTVGIGEGFLLHWAVPAIDLGTAILVSVLTDMLVVYFLGKYVGLVVRDYLMHRAVADDSEDEDAEEELDDDEVIVEPLGKLGGYRLSTPAIRERKRRKKR